MTGLSQEDRRLRGGRLSEAKALYTVSSGSSLTSGMAGSYQVTSLVLERKIRVWIWIRWSWIIFILCITNGFVHVVG